MSFNIEIMNAFFSKLTLEQIYNSVIVFIVVLIIAMASVALFRPISAHQFRQAFALSQQYNLPQTQDLAAHLVQQQHMTRGQYLKLMQAYQQESTRANQLPPIQED